MTMTRFFILLILSLLPCFVMSQGLKDSVVVNELLDSWTLGLTESGDEVADIRVFNKFKSLFVADALIADDVNGIYSPASTNSPAAYVTVAKPVEVYAHNIALQFKNLKTSVTAPITYNYQKLATDSLVTVSITRTISGEKYRQYIIGNIDSLVQHMVTYRTDQNQLEEVNTEQVAQDIKNMINDRDNRTYQFRATNTLLVTMHIKDGIPKITSIGFDPSTNIETAACINDDDTDGIINEEDQCPGQSGDFTAAGCPDSDLDGIGDADDKCDYIYGATGNSGCPPDYFLSNVTISAWIGAQLNHAGLSMPSLDQLGYENVDFLQSAEGSLETPGLTISPVIGADIAWFFGKKKKRSGIAVGITYTSFSADYLITESAVYTYRSNDGHDDYRRKITWEAGSTETVDYKIINVPILFRYRDMFGKKNTEKESYRWSWEFSIGPSYIIFNNTAKYNATLDMEGLYQIDTISQDAIAYYDYFNEGSTWNILLTAADINQQDSVPGADAVFDLLNSSGYDFATDKNYEGENDNANRSSIAFNFMFDITYKLDDQGKIALKFGAAGCFAPLQNQTSGYQLVDATSDPYNPLYNSKAKSVYYAVGVHGGLVFNF